LAASKLTPGSIKIDIGQHQNGDWVAYSARAEGEKVDRVEEIEDGQRENLYRAE
jgi:hypothetical protein